MEVHSIYALRVTQSLKFFHGTKTMTDHLCDRVLIMFRNFVYFAGAFIETLILWLYSFKVDLQSFPSCKLTTEICNGQLNEHTVSQAC